MTSCQRNRVWVLVSAIACVTLGSTGYAQRKLAQQLGVTRGVCVVLEDGATGIELARQTELVVYIQTSKQQDAALTSSRAAKAGLLGRRVYVAHGPPTRIHLANNLADGVIIGTGTSFTNAVKKEVLRVIHPGAKILQSGKQPIVKSRPANTDDWKHPYHGPDNNPQSSDKVARGPFLTQFTGEPWYATMPQMTVISGGKIYKVFGNRASAQPQWPVLNTLMCINAFNGTILWKRSVNPDFMLHRNTFIATPDTLYFADDKSCQLIDPATGKVRHEIVAPKDLSDGPVWKWMAIKDNTLYALVGEQEPVAKSNKGNRYRGAGWPWWKISNYRFGFGRTVLAIDLKTRQVKWHHREKQPLDSRAMCMSTGRLFLYSHAKFLAALDTQTGKPLWRTTDRSVLKAIGEHDPAQHWMKGFASSVYAKCSAKAIYFAGPTRKNIAAVSASDGKLLWKRGGGNSQLVLRNDGVYALGEGSPRTKEKTSFKLDALSGEVLANFPSRDRCTRATGCVDSIFTRGGRGGSTAMFNVSSAQPTRSVIGPMRPACQDGVLVAHGQLYWGPWKCRCDGTQIGVMCLATGGSFKYDAPATEGERLVQSPSVSQVAAFGGQADWPSYRRDNQRTTRIDIDLPQRVKTSWNNKPSGSNVATAPVIAGGHAFVGGSNGVVRAIDLKTGKTKWTAHTGGYIKVSPTYWQGRIFVGSGDGWAYCFEAATGKTLWKFRAAPVERRVMIYGSLLSTWPVGSGVLVDDQGVAYLGAGMFNYDGSHFFALDAATGRIRWQKHSNGILEGKEPIRGAGVQSPWLLKGKSVFLSGGGQAPLLAFDRQTGKVSRRGGGRGKDLFVFRNQVRATGYPLYWRQEDLHHVENASINSSRGYVTIIRSRIVLVGDKKNAKGQPVAEWSITPFNDISALAVTGNGFVVAGTSRQGGKQTHGLHAYNLADGKLVWKETLPAAPVSWGIAIDKSSRIVVSTQDGQVLAYGQTR